MVDISHFDDASPNEEIGGFVGDGSWHSLGTVAEVRALLAMNAAAHDLLAALKLVVTRCGPNSEDGKQARAAISKAEQPR